MDIFSFATSAMFPLYMAINNLSAFDITKFILLFYYHKALTWYMPEPNNLLSTYFWAGFMPSLWMWLYVAALFVTRGLLRSEKLVNWLRWALDIEKNPFRSIGAVAATLAFIASVAIIIISAEVSRISAAT